MLWLFVYNQLFVHYTSVFQSELESLYSFIKHRSFSVSLSRFTNIRETSVLQ